MHAHTVPQLMASVGTYHDGRTRVMSRFDGISKIKYAMKKMEINIAYSVCGSLVSRLVSLCFGAEC